MKDFFFAHTQIIQNKNYFTINKHMKVKNITSTTDGAFKKEKNLLIRNV